MSTRNLTLDDKDEFMRDFIFQNVTMPKEMKKERDDFFKILYGGFPIAREVSEPVTLHWKSNPLHYSVLCAMLKQYCETLLKTGKTINLIMEEQLQNFCRQFFKTAVQRQDGLIYVTVDCLMIHINILVSLMRDLWAGHVKTTEGTLFTSTKEFERDVALNFFDRVKSRA